MGAPALSLPDSLRQIKQRSRSVCHIMPDAAGMVLVVLMGSTLLCEMGRHYSPKYRQSQSGRNAAALTLPRSGCPVRHA